MPVRKFLIACVASVVVQAVPTAADPLPELLHNVVILVADGLRSAMVNDQTAPNMARFASEGVRPENSHSPFPTTTMANASALVTGHAIGDTGMFGNTISSRFRARATASRRSWRRIHPDGSQHYQEDSPDALAPGSNACPRDSLPSTWPKTAG
jgi:Type I phosphodiesterase / nucleotide pyrophosphatase